MTIKGTRFYEFESRTLHDLLLAGSSSCQIDDCFKVVFYNEIRTTDVVGLQQRGCSRRLTPSVEGRLLYC